MNLRKYARGKPCQIRLSGICNGNSETTVLAHVRMAGLTGMGLKANDALAAWSCSACHDAVDGRAHKDLEKDFRDLALLQGVMRTQYKLIREGILKCE